MATKTVLQKINSLEYFDGLRAVKDILRNIFSSITSLETNSVLLYKREGNNEALTSGLLTVGKRYLIYTLQLGDDFSNVGYILDTPSFIATGTTPLVWTNSTSVQYQNLTYSEIFNDTGAVLSIDENATNGTRLKLTSTNNIFSNDKYFFTGEGTNLIYQDVNTVYLPQGKGKLEIYN